jgi:hypothetical protein
LKLDDKVASRPDLIFNGWNISTTPATNGVGIHHPQGDIKKISTYTRALQNDSDGETHWMLQWAETPTNWGVTEPGSSGSPLFDQNKYIVGTLTSGYADCTHPSGHDFYGKMSYHWNKNGNTPAEQLKPWLDPDNKGVTKLQSTGGPSYIWWPNAINTLSIRLKRGDYPEMKVYDVLGRLVMQKKITKKEVDEKNIFLLDISTLSAGLYVIVLTGDNGRKTQKIIKQ